MLKITNCKEVEGKKIYTMKDNENKDLKITIVDGIVTIEEKGKKDQTLKAQTRTKKYLEIVASYESKKEESNKKKMEKESKKAEKFNQDVEQTFENEVVNEIQENFDNVEKIENVEIVNLEDVQKEEENKIENEQPLVLTSEEELNKDKENSLVVAKFGNVLQEKEKNYLIDVIENAKEEEYQNLDLRISLIDVMIDDTCKAHKVKNENGGERWTNFTMFIGSDNKVLDVQLMNAMQIMMDKYLQLLEQEKFEDGRKFFRGDTAKFNTYNGIIMKNGNSIQIPFWENNVVEYKEGEMECMKNILRIPYQNNVGEIRKYVHIAYYLAKKQVLNFYKGMKKIKLAQQKEEEKQRKQA